MGENGDPHIRIEAIYTRDQFKYKLNEAGDGYIAEKLVYTSENEDFAIVVPDTYRGLPVVAVGDGACDYENSSSQGIFDRATHVTIGKNVKTIGERAFTGRIVDWDNRYDLVIPNGVTSIGAYAFQNCTFKKIVLPEGLTEIAPYTFWECDLLKSIVIPEGVTVIGEGAFQYIDLSGGITLPSTLTAIEKEAFVNSDVTEIIILASVKEIGEGTFKMTNLTSAKFLAGVEVVGAYMFEDCANLATVELPDTLKKIGINAFKNTAFYQNLNREGYGLYYGSYLLGNTGYVNYRAEIIEGTVLIADGAFVSMQDMKVLTLPSSLKYIGENAFVGCIGLQEIVIPEGVIEIGARAFSKCISLHSATLPANLVTMAEGVFSECERLENVTFHANMTVIPAETFMKCGALAQIEIPLGVTEIGASAFQGCTALTDISLPDSLVEIGVSAFQGCTALTDVSLPDSVTELGAHVFSGCDSLTFIALPNGIRVIPSYAFADSGLTSVQLPERLGLIMDHAFERCRLQSLELSTQTPLSIWSDAFRGNAQLTELTLPANVIGIEPNAFAACGNLVSVTFLHTEGGWTLTHPELAVNQGGRKKLACEDLGDPAVAAGYLTGDYGQYHWAYNKDFEN